MIWVRHGLRALNLHAAEEIRCGEVGEGVTAVFPNGHRVFVEASWTEIVRAARSGEIVLTAVFGPTVGQPESRRIRGDRP